ncbi:DNA polymerase/3'-5' exonuclease PolX [Filimonas effusa]|uniref:DNA polymerase/3'-5' exonuclease PolX n=1 Tax=Filimonas effusa TaxID=2508721 RepID=A0A4Q1DCK9_9BACT|nr:DNA polymerase/3'-5' exonuclease PolX [Filimonas effusa]RXK87100.1 DNA polymerase/3'-5' exonuclease PolX [Filimonas effusa]
MLNAQIADNFSLLGKLMEIHGENSFKTKSYSTAAFTIEKLPVELSTLPEEKIFSIKGIGDAIGKKILVQLQTGQLPQLNEYLAQTPAGILEMMSIKGIGPKKIATIWKELEVETIGELLYACNENRLLLYKGFGAKTQQNIKDSIEFFLSNQGNYLYAQVASYAAQFTQELLQKFEGWLVQLTGDFRRQLEIINKLEWVTTIPAADLRVFLESNGLQWQTAADGYEEYRGQENIALQFYHTNAEAYYSTLFKTSSSAVFLDCFEQQYGSVPATAASEEAIFSASSLAYIPACLRETDQFLPRAAAQTLPVLIQPGDITGIIHSHSKWSDGANSIEEMAVAAKQQGLQFLVISDHSKSAFYANGLNEARIAAQHEEIDSLNSKLAPFHIFKSVESDILNDGNLDYGDDVLKSFDMVIASVHSNLKMNEEKAMARLLKAIENPYTTILGHMTGRLLLSRSGYPVDHKKIIDACAANNVIIELNAHPRRLDIDWRWIHYALEKDVLISINPDAHAVAGFHDIVYGVLAAQKAGVTKEQNFSSFSLEAVFERIKK